MRWALLALALLLATGVAAAADNDPGHDQLYLEEDRDSNLTGRLNISKTLEVANTIFSSYLDILGNGTQPSSSFTQIYARSAGNDLVLNAPTQLVLLRDSGSLVRIGSSGVDLNVSQDLYVGEDAYVLEELNVTGNIYTGGTLIQKRVSGTCGAGEAIDTINEDGTVTCESVSGASSGGGWTNSSTTTSTGLDVKVDTDVFVVNATDDTVTISGSSVCTKANGLCNQSVSGGDDETGGWTNTSTTTSTTLNVDIEEDLVHNGSYNLTPGDFIHRSTIDPAVTYEAAYTDGTLLYFVTSNPDQLHIYDIADASNPTLLGTYSLPSDPQDVAVSAGFAYVAVEGSTPHLAIIDVTNPRAPTYVGNYTEDAASPEDITQVETDGRLLYLTRENQVGSGRASLDIIDVADPTTPRLLSSTLYEDYSGTSGEPVQKVQGDFVYILMTSLNGGFQAIAEVEAVNVTDPENPVELTVYTLGNTSVNSYGFDVQGAYGYGTVDFNAGDSFLFIFNLSNPNSITEVSDTNLGAIDAREIIVSGSYAYIADNTNTAILVYDISDPTSPVLVQTADSFSTTKDLVIAGRTVVSVSSSSGVYLLEMEGIDAHAAQIDSLGAATLTVGRSASIRGPLRVREAIEAGGLFIHGDSAFIGNVSTNGSFYAAGSEVCTASNGLCSSGGDDETGGWTNTSTTTSTSLDAVVGTDALLVNATTKRVGINTTEPNATLQLEGTGTSLLFEPNYKDGPLINTTGGTNLTIDSSGGSIIIKLT